MTHITMVGLGAVGVATAGTLLQEGLASRMTFFDVLNEKAEGEAWDFTHAAGLLPTCEVDSLPYERLFGADICIVSAGVKSRPGESRLNLLERNIEVVEEVCERFEKNGFPRILLVLTNPVDVITECFTRRLAGRNVVVFGSGTSLDTYRLKQMIAAKAKVHASNAHAWVIGEHGDSSVSLFSSARIGCIPLLNYLHQGELVFTSDDFEAMSQEVRGAAQKIIERKGATAHAIGLTAGRLIRAVVKNENIIVPVSVRVEQDVCLSVPCQINSWGAGPALQVPLSEAEQIAFKNSLTIVKKACQLLPQNKTKIAWSP